MDLKTLEQVEAQVNELMWQLDDEVASAVLDEVLEIVKFLKKGAV